MRKKRTIIQWLGSLELAVFIMLAITVLSAVGTIVESKFDARTAQKLVYHSIYMYVTLVALCITLTAVMVDRWPWKRRHASFVLAHIGIIMLVFGSWVTKQYGIDGSMSFAIGEKSNRILLMDQEVAVYSYFLDARPERIFVQDVDFLSKAPTEKKPLIVQTAQGAIKFTDYIPYALRDEKIARSQDPQDPPALRFQLQNPQTHVSRWIQIPRRRTQEVINLGPAEVVLTTQKYKYTGGNKLVFISTDKGLKYQVYSRKLGGLSHEGDLKEGGVAETGWMGFKVRLFNYYKNARLNKDFQKLASPNKMSTSAVQVNFQGKSHWLGENSTLRLFTNDQAYIVTYGAKQIALDFDLKLKKFDIGRYQGTMRAASYESTVDVIDRKTKSKELSDIKVFMNNPLKHKSFTFYQASFTEDENGRPESSVLSVNWDPGRWLKYLGSLLIVFGSFLLFYFKNLDFKRKK